MCSFSICDITLDGINPTSSHSHMKLKGSDSSDKINSTSSRNCASLNRWPFSVRDLRRWNPITSRTIRSSIAQIKRRSHVASDGGSTSETQNGINDDLFCFDKMRTIHPLDERTYQGLNQAPPSQLSNPLPVALPHSLRAYDMPSDSTPFYDTPVALSSQDLMSGSIKKIYFYFALCFVQLLLTCFYV